MEKGIVNWDDIQETEYINEEGEYTLKIIEVAKDEDGNETQMSTNGKEFHKYICENKEHQRINISLYIIDKAMWKYKAFVSACGLPTTGSVDVYSLPKMLVGKKFIGVVKRQPDRINVETGMPEQSKYFEVTKFYKVEE